MAAWLMLAKAGSKRIGEGYDDNPATHYSWDSTVPNHATVARRSDWTPIFRGFSPLRRTAYAHRPGCDTRGMRIRLTKVIADEHADLDGM